MNTQGWIRGILSRNYSPNKFILLVLDILSREFELEIKLIEFNDKFLMIFDKYCTYLSNEDIHKLQMKGPYCLDRYILEKIKEQGFEFDYNRSQYIQYCYSIFPE